MMNNAYDQLKPAERVFVDSYLADMSPNPTAAMRRVEDYMQGEGIDMAEYAPVRNAPHHVRQMLLRPLVQAAIAERQEAFARDMRIDARRVFAEVANIATANIGDHLEDDWSLRPKSDLSPAQLASVQAVEVKYDQFGNRNVKFKMHDKLGALDKLMKFFGMFEADNAQKMFAAVTGEPSSRPITQDMTTEEAADRYARLRG